MKTKFTKILSLVLVFALTAAVALTFTSCDNGKTPAPTKTGTVTAPATTPATAQTGDATKDEAKITIVVSVTTKDGSTKDFTINTAEKNLYAAVNSLGIIAGEDSAYGFYLKTVEGVTADYDTDGAYWALYKGGEYLMTGMESTPIADGEHYEIVYTTAK